MMLDDILLVLNAISQLQRRLELSQGELLAMARRIAADDNLRTIDRLTAEERKQLALELMSLVGTTRAAELTLMAGGRLAMAAG